MLALLLAPSGLLSPTPVQPRAAARVSPAMSAPSSLRWSRRQLVPAVAAWAAASRFAPSARALENSKGPIWTSGRSDPIRPTSKDKADGTKKDPKYLSCLNDCVPQCSSTYGTDTGRPKERSDCFDECQDQCCSTCASPANARTALLSSAPATATATARLHAHAVLSHPTQVPAVHVHYPKVTL